MQKVQIKLGYLIAIVVGSVLLVALMGLAAAAPAAPLHSANQALAVPTPITTPSLLDAIQTTSNAIIGGDVTVAGSQSNSSWWAVSAPTAIASATPAAVINSAGVSNLLELRQASTPVTQFNSSGGLTQQQWVNIAAPTAIASATPAVVINTAGVSNLTEWRKNATPVAYMDSTGIISSTKSIQTSSYFQGGATAAVASATTIAPCAGAVCHISGTTTITDMTGYDTAGPGRTVCLIFDGSLTFTDGNHLKLAGNLSATADDTICLVSDGNNWYELSRSVN